MRSFWRVPSAVLFRHGLPSLLLVGLLVGFVPAGDRRPRDDDAKPLVVPPVFDKDVPETVQDLKEIQGHVKSILDRTIRTTVGIRVGASQGSGVIVTKDGYVLTAGHVSATPNRDCLVVLPDGRKLKGKTLGWNKGIDSGLVRITEPGEYPYSEMAKSADVKKGQWCLAIGHPNGIQPGRTPVVRLGRIQEASKTFLRSDCTLVGGDSGGPLFDMQGRVIGIHSRIGGPITANIHVPVDTYTETWDRLAKGEEWGAGLFGFGGKGGGEPYLGLRFDPDANGLKIANVSADSPAAKAGLMVNDVILSFDGKKVSKLEELTPLLQAKRPGNEVTLEVLRGDQTITVRVTLGKRPTSNPEP